MYSIHYIILFVKITFNIRCLTIFRRNNIHSRIDRQQHGVYRAVHVHTNEGLKHFQAKFGETKELNKGRDLHGQFSDNVRPTVDTDTVDGYDGRFDDDHFESREYKFIETFASRTQHVSTLFMSELELCGC